MKENNTKNWIDKSRDKALLYFSQLIEELLFNYTIDSFKLPAHNVNTLIAEAKKTIEHINNGILKEGTYDSVKAELIEIIGKDIIFTELLKTNTEITIKILNNKNLQETDRLLQYLQVKLQGDYWKMLCETIERKITENDFDDLNRLTKYLIIEIIGRNYSVEYINLIQSRIFHHRSVDGISSFQAFIESFGNEERDYTVIFKVSNSFLQFKEFFSDEIILLRDSIEIADDNDRISQFLNLQGSILEFKTKAKDPFKAYSRAQYYLENVCANLIFLQHQADFTISKIGLIKEDTIYYYYTGANNPIFRRPDDLLTERAKNKLSIILKCMNSKVFEQNSKQRIALAYFRHLNSIRSISFETQLVDMWSGIEILVPVYKKDSSDKICQICDSIIPLITAEYFFKITYYLYKGIHRAYKKGSIIRILRSIDEKLYFAFLKCLMMKQYEAEYLHIQAILESYPLLQKRLDYYKNKLSDPKEILRLYQNHQTRVGWQLQRIYRGRNLIIHSGKTPYRLDTLIENLHYYFDSTINMINMEASSSQKYTTLEHVFLTYKFRDANYIKFLEKNKNSQIDETFIKAIIRKEF